MSRSLAGTNRTTFLYLQRADPPPPQKKNAINTFLEKLTSFISVGDQDKILAPEICCSSCSMRLTGWLKGMHISMPFAVPMVLREPGSHLDDRCFCVTDITGFSVQSKHKIEYPNIPSALRPVFHKDSLPGSEPPEKYTLDSEPESEDASPEGEASTREDQDFSVCSTIQPHLITQAELNDLVRDLDLTKTKDKYLD
jgi:hypothetical protein